MPNITHLDGQMLLNGKSHEGISRPDSSQYLHLVSIPQA